MPPAHRAPPSPSIRQLVDRLQTPDGMARLIANALDRCVLDELTLHSHLECMANHGAEGIVLVGMDDPAHTVVRVRVSIEGVYTLTTSENPGD